jgi:perosamine synthetase
MSSMQAALGLAQLERVEELIGKKRVIFDWYYEELKDFQRVTLNYEGIETKNSYWMVTIILDKKYNVQKEEIIEKLKEYNIDSRPFFFPLSSLTAYKHFVNTSKAKKNNESAYTISPYGINLPCGMNITKNDVKYVCDSLKSILFKLKWK